MDVFFRGVLFNFFTQAAQVPENETILTRTTDTKYRLFNPFTTAPQLGVNYHYGPDYLRATGTGDYQAPRWFNFSVGIRF